MEDHRGISAEVRETISPPRARLVLDDTRQRCHSDRGRGCADRSDRPAWLESWSGAEVCNAIVARSGRGSLEDSCPWINGAPLYKGNRRDPKPSHRLRGVVSRSVS